MMLKKSDTKSLQLKKPLICCDSFKGSLTACDAGIATERAIRRAETAKSLSGEPAAVMHCPMSDGGAGLLESLFFSKSTDSTVGDVWQSHFTRVQVPADRIIGPLCEPLDPSRDSVYFACDMAHRTVVIEMAVASGLPLLPEDKKNPLRTTSYGVGQVIQYAMEYVARESHELNCAVSVYLGIGGSATNDGGLGALQALGVELFVSDDTVPPLSLSRPFTGGDLKRLKGIRISDRCRHVFFSDSCEEKGSFYCKEIRLICDVTVPLIGPHGATRVFGPQKCNASWDKNHRTHVLDELEHGMLHAAQCVVESMRDDSQLCCSGDKCTEFEKLCFSAGGGGAGGMSGFFRYILQATWMQGTDAVAELLGFHTKLQCCDYMITGEGSFDEQTIGYNKTIGRLLQMVVLHNVEQKRNQKHTQEKRVGVKDVMVICGRTTYRSGGEVRRVLLSHMTDSYVKTKGHVGLCGDCHVHGVDELETAAPRIHLLSLTPRHFPVAKALRDAAQCVEELIARYLSGETDVAEQSSHM